MNHLFTDWNIQQLNLILENDALVNVEPEKTEEAVCHCQQDTGKCPNGLEFTGQCKHVALDLS